MLGIPNYGYVFTLPYLRGISRAPSIGNQFAIELAARFGAQIQFDEEAQAPFFEYFGNDRRKHIVWFEDVRSIQQKLNLVDEFDMIGAGYWTVMRPFIQNWIYLSINYKIRKVV